jgi:hypothetical protein
MTGLIPQEQLDESRRRYFEANPTPAMICVRWLRDDPSLTVAQLALLVGRSRGWVRKVLKASALQPARAGKRKTLIS